MPTLKLKNLNPTEEQDQIALVDWHKTILEPLGTRLHASPNGGSRHILEAMKLKRMGLSAGFPDLFFPVITKSYPGLFVEMKRVKGGVLSSEQKSWIDYLNNQGYRAVVCEGFDEARDEVESYFHTLLTR